MAKRKGRGVQSQLADTAVLETSAGQSNQELDKDMVSHQVDPLLTFTEAAELIGKSASTVRSWADQGLIATLKDPSGLRRVRQSEFERFYGATAMAQAAREKQERLDKMREDRAEWQQDINRMTKAYDRRKAAENASKEEDD